MTRIILNGCCGRMGRTIARLVDDTENIKIVAGADLYGDAYSHFPVFKTLSDIKVDADVVVDFSNSDCLDTLLTFVLEKKMPVVIATTGFTGEEEKKIIEYSKYIPIFKSANMSYSINMFQHILREIAPKLSDTDIEIIETHHNRKIDSPSGTAQMLADTINEALGGGYVCEYDRHSKNVKRAKNI